VKTYRVLVVDDSAFMRRVLPEILATDPSLEVVGTAMDGYFALKKIRELSPDVVTLDIDMPRMDGLETLRRIMEEHRTPVVIVSSMAHKDAEPTIRALELGAVDVVAKPQGAISLHIQEIGFELIAKVRAAAEAKGRQGWPAPPPRPVALPPPPTGKAVPVRPLKMVVAIGTSTGGPNALTSILPRIPADIPAGFLIVQHMPPGFIGMFATRLNSLCPMEVKEARDGDLVVPGRALIAPADRHLKVARLPLGVMAMVGDAPPVHGHRPSVDVLFRSVAVEFGTSAVGIILTGMGSDGADGLGEIRAAGGLTVAQDAASCVVFGMPRVAIERNHAARVMPLDDIPSFLIEYLEGRVEHHGEERRDRNQAVQVPGS
jgi:two-component system chemotaxis response regulator CheB